MTLRRRSALVAGLSLACPALLRAQAPVAVTDRLGRRVALARPAQRIVLAQGRLLSLMGLIHPDPVSLLAGWASDLPVVLPDEYAAWTRRFPVLASLPSLGRQVAAGMNIEQLVTLQPDLVLLSRGAAGTLDAQGRSAVVERIEALGLKTAVIDCMARPLVETAPSISVLGALIGREAQAAALREFYEGRMARLAGWFATNKPPVVKVMLHNHGGGRECCYSIATGSFADLLAEVGGHSIAADFLRRPLGQLHKEYVLTQPWDAYLTTGGVYNGRGGVSMGAGVTPEEARASLAAMLKTQGLDILPPVQAGRAYALWHGFNETPLHCLALEAMAGWLHPAARAVFDPAAGLRDVNQRFAAVPAEGTYWTQL
ncbi:ABC transporter substrate-binding protein [Roseomonas sp. 18066]|uniref:ABC transporter substrate-binding protein n=1 Tax=Roseomonas sp. 18066 TaxID=2681412 RepID=UPI0013578686|nr:ABC transporter substrate-binding protein [Roseomonas sp. 18066]